MWQTGRKECVSALYGNDLVAADMSENATKKNYVSYKEDLQ